MKSIFLAFTICLLSQTLDASVKIYVSPRGDDGNTGSLHQPLATFEGARDKIRELRLDKQITDTVFVEVQSGTYYISHAWMLTGKDSGTPQAPVIFRGDENDRPVVCGGKKTDRFEEVTPGLWRVYIPEVADLGFYFEQLYVNGQRRFRAQTPNKGEFVKVKRIEETVLDASGSQGPTFAVQKMVVPAEYLPILNDIDKSEWNDVLMVFYHKWDNTRKRVEHINALDSTICFTGEAMRVYNKIDSQSLCVVENYRKALDSPGEWFLQRDGYLYYIPLPGETIEDTECVYPVTDKLLTITGDEGRAVSSVRFENICFEATAYRTPPEGNEPMQAAAGIDAAIMLDYANNIEFVNCDIARTGQYAIWFRKHCSYSKVEHCYLYDLGGGGVKIGDYSSPEFIKTGQGETAATHHITVHNNIIQHGGYVFPCAVGVIIFHGSDNTVTHNDIADLRYTGVSVGWIWGYAPSPSKRNKIEFNRIHHLGWGELSDMGGVYTLGASEGTTVSNNVIHHIHSFTYGGWGLYTDEGSYGVCMENNLVYKCKSAGFHQHYGRENVIRNNIFAFNLLSQMQLTRPEEHLSFSFINNIIYFGKGLLYMDKGSDSWLKAQTVIDRNCYWDRRAPQPDFHGLSFSDWKKLGKDKHSIIADPLFVNPDAFDFRFSNPRVAKKIGFKPFDYSRAGVYGDQEWKMKAVLTDELKEQFDALPVYQ